MMDKVQIFEHRRYFRKRASKSRLVCGMGSRHQCLDNSLTSSFFLDTSRFCCCLFCPVFLSWLVFRVCSVLFFVLWVCLREASTFGSTDLDLVSFDSVQSIKMMTQSFRLAARAATRIAAPFQRHAVRNMGVAVRDPVLVLLFFFLCCELLIPVSQNAESTIWLPG